MQYFIILTTAILILNPLITQGQTSFKLMEDPLITSDYASTGGVSWVDYDGDGNMDLFITNGYTVTQKDPPPKKNRLYQNKGDGIFTEITNTPLHQDDGYSSGSTWGDIDNDGDLDVFVSNQRDQDNFLYLNNGDGSFTKVREGPIVKSGGWSYGASWVDIDNDGLLDLYVSNGGLSHREVDFIYRNKGGAQFEKMELEPFIRDTISSAGSIWCDFDMDGDMDLFLSSSVDNNILYRNEGNWKFSKVLETPVTGAFERDRFFMNRAVTASWIDYDNDGDFDLFIPHRGGVNPYLFKNDGKGNFTEITDDPLARESVNAYNAATGDIDNDGDEDVIIVPWGGRTEVFENLGGHFKRSIFGDLGRIMNYSSSIALSDPDNDGDLDVYIGHWPNYPGKEELNQYYENQSKNDNNWLKIKLVGTHSNRSGIGARITVKNSNGQQSRQVSGQPNWRSFSGLVQHFGLGDAGVVNEIIIDWPSGKQTILEVKEVNKLIVIEEE